MSFWDQFVEELESIGRIAAEWIPRILVALLVLLIGRWVLRLIRRWIERLLDLPAVRGVFERAGISQAMQPSGRSAGSVVAMIVYTWLVVGLWLIVFRILDIPDIVDLLERLLAWIPIVILAAVVVLVAAAAANWVADLVRPFAEARNVSWLAAAVRTAIIVFGVLFALDLLDIRFAEDLVKIVFAAAGIALAIAFGVGGIDTAKEWWAKYASPRD